ncbi:MAG: hypothetical protein O7I42_20940 [Alphaproteobacteria bacterium]|nr:hypothetical protein [Alphaproteobacteria bacterium]
MPRKTFVLFSLISLVIFAMPVTTQATRVVYLPGVYQVAGTDPDGTKYTGTVTVTRTRATLRVVWKIGSRVWRGTGLRVGNILSVGYNGGVAAYRIVHSKRFEGEWAPHGSAKTGREIWTR